MEGEPSDLAAASVGPLPRSKHRVGPAGVTNTFLSSAALNPAAVNLVLSGAVKWTGSLQNQGVGVWSDWRNGSVGG